MMYTIEVESSYEQLWRYNMIVMCGGFSATSESLYVVSQRDIISDIENPIECEPDGYTLPRRVSLRAAKADNIRAIVYVVPHTLPIGRDVDQNPAFDALVTITKSGKEIYRNIHKVNQWGGASIEIKI